MVWPLIMSSTGDMYKNWQSWKVAFLQDVRHINYQKPEQTKIDLLKNKIGHAALAVPSIYDIIHNQSRNRSTVCTLNNVLRNLDEFFSDMKNELRERYIFFNTFRSENESIELHINNLKMKAIHCNFEGTRDVVIRDKVIANLRDAYLRNELLETLNLDLETLINICNLYECRNRNNITVKTTDALNNNKNGVKDRPNSNQKVNTNINDKDKTGPKNDKDSNNVTDRACPKDSNINSKTKTNPKTDNSGNNITGTACQKNSNINDNTKTNPKTDNSGKNVTGTACQKNSNNNGKTKSDLKNDNKMTIPRRHTYSENNAEADFAMNNLPESRLERFKQQNSNTNRDFRDVNSNHNTNTTRRNSESFVTDFRRNCKRCNEKHSHKSCPAWGYKCANCGQRNHYTSCCPMKPLERNMQQINMNVTENMPNRNVAQLDDNPKPIPPSNYNFAAHTTLPCTNINMIPSAPVFSEVENSLYPNLNDVQIPAKIPPQKLEARDVNTVSKTRTPIIKNNKKSRSDPDVCNVS